MVERYHALIEPHNLKHLLEIQKHMPVKTSLKYLVNLFLSERLTQQESPIKITTIPTATKKDVRKNLSANL